jgi:Protein of unknown function (DUF3570)
VASFFSRPARAEAPTIRASSEVGAYRDSFATAVLTPTVATRVESPTAGWSVGGRYLVDVVSAASPDVVSTASPRWTETRHAGNADVRYKPGAFGAGLGVSASYTPDYFSRGAQGSAILDLDPDKTWTLSAGFGFARDTIGRTGTSFSTFSRELDTYSASLGLSRVIGPRTLGTIVADGYLEHGDQSKPYRYVPLFLPSDVSRVGRGATIDTVSRLRIGARPLEQLPLSRERLAITARLAHRFDGLTLRAEERLYGDTWGMPASTTDVRLYFDIGRRVVAGPTLRAHVQGKTDFYRRAYAASGSGDIPSLRTGDRELGALFSMSGGGLFRLGLGAHPEPMAFALGLTVDGTYTSFADALYVTHRFAGLATLSFEARF